MSNVARPEGQGQRGTPRIPSDSLFYEKIVPGLLIILAALTIIIVLIATGVFLGLIRY